MLDEYVSFLKQKMQKAKVRDLSIDEVNTELLDMIAGNTFGVDVAFAILGDLSGYYDTIEEAPCQYTVAYEVAESVLDHLEPVSDEVKIDEMGMPSAPPPLKKRSADERSLSFVISRLEELCIKFGTCISKCSCPECKDACVEMNDDDK